LQRKFFFLSWRLTKFSLIQRNKYTPPKRLDHCSSSLPHHVSI
jgi:hypothetical protein